MTERVRTSDDVTALAARILAPRQRPLVVVSSDPRTDGFVLDVDELADDVRDIADLVLISTGDLTRELDALLPDKTQVYGGAGRSYPVDFGSDSDWRRSPLRFPSAKATQQLVGDVLGQAAAAGAFEQPSARRVEASGVVRGFIADDSRALVDIDGRGPATISRELTHPPIPLSWSLRKGQRVTGVLDLDTRLLLVEQPTPTTAQLADAFPHRCVTLALVSKVSPARAALLLHPSAEFTLRRADVSSNPLDTVDLLVAEGDVVAARVAHLSDGTLHLSLTDVDDDEQVVPPLSLTTGGPPWLEEARPLTLQTTDAAGDLAALDEAAAARIPGGDPAAALTPALTGEGSVGEDVRGGTTAASAPPTSQPAPDASAPAPRPMPGPGLHHVDPPSAEHVPAAEPAAPVADSAPGAALQSVQLQLAAERARSADLERRLAEAAADDSSISRLRAQASGAEARLREELAERGDLEKQLRELKEQHRATTRAVRQARQAAPIPTGDDRDARRSRWATDEGWVRHEVYLAWVDRIEPAERESWTIGGYQVGPEFAASLDLLDAGQFAKAMKAVVDAVTGRIRDIPSREVHPLREGDGASAPDVVRADGGKCYRAYIEQKTSAARRLHYWVLPGGDIELGRIVIHDDVRP